MITDEEIRRLCRMWALNIDEEARLLFDEGQRLFIIKETAAALLELGEISVEWEVEKG